jgi:hypothetical protein
MSSLDKVEWRRALGVKRKGAEVISGAFFDVLRLRSARRSEFQHSVKPDRPLIAARILLERLELGRQCRVVANFRANK